MQRRILLVALVTFAPAVVHSQTNPLWHEQKVKNYLPHMTSPEVRDLLTRTDIALIPVPSLEQHGLHGPIGTDFYYGVELAKLIAQRTDVLVAPVLLAGQAGYHMGFPGSITLSANTVQQVYFETAQSLIQHGFRRFLFLNSHTGNQHITRFVMDRVNQETPGVALDLLEAAATMGSLTPQANAAPRPRPFDRHAGVIETSFGAVPVSFHSFAGTGPTGNADSSTTPRGVGAAPEGW
jgi:creatinine amidohydrolase